MSATSGGRILSPSTECVPGGLGFGLFGGIGPVPFVLNRASLEAAAEQTGKILVVFEWFGGNDGLNTIVPYGDPMYYKHRPTIGVKERDGSGSRCAWKSSI